MDEFILVSNGLNGIYSAQYFAKNIPFEDVSGISLEDWKILQAGPDHEDYFMIWEMSLETLEVMHNGEKYLVHENQDIWIYPERIHDSINWDEIKA